MTDYEILTKIQVGVAKIEEHLNAINGRLDRGNEKFEAHELKMKALDVDIVENARKIALYRGISIGIIGLIGVLLGALKAFNIF